MAGLLCREGTGQLGTHQVTSPSRARLHTHSSLPFAQVHECHAHPGVWRLKKKNARVPFQCTCSRDAVGTGSEDLRAEMVSFPVPFRAQISEDSVLETTEGRFWRRQIQVKTWFLHMRPSLAEPTPRRSLSGVRHTAGASCLCAPQGRGRDAAAATQASVRAGRLESRAQPASPRPTPALPALCFCSGLWAAGPWGPCKAPASPGVQGLVSGVLGAGTVSVSPWLWIGAVL